MLLSKSSRRDRGLAYCNNKNESLFVSKVDKKKIKKDIYDQYRNMYTKIITLMKVCQSCVFTLPNSHFFVKILFMFEEKHVGNLIL